MYLTRDSNPGPLDYEASALPTELLSTEIFGEKNLHISMYYTKIANFDFKLNLLKGPSIDFFLSHVFEITYVPRFQNALVCSWAFNLGLFTTTGGTVTYFLLCIMYWSVFKNS